MEWLFIIAEIVFIISVPVAAFVYHRYRYDQKNLRMLSQDIKNELLSNDSRGTISQDVMDMIRRHIKRTHLIWACIAAAVFSVCALLGEPLMLVCGAAVVCFIAADMLIRLKKTAHSDELIKVKAWIFHSANMEATAVYYDMKHLKYRAFTQSTFFDNSMRLRAGTYVYLIVRRTDKLYKPVMILDF